MSTAADGVEGAPGCGAHGGPRAPRAPHPGALPLVTSRNNSHPSAFRVAKAYVHACGKGTLGLYYGDHVAFGSLACGSWSCASCRKRLAARLLDRIRRGMESRPSMTRTFVTLTVDPSKFGAVPIGSAFWNSDDTPCFDPDRAARSSILWSEPSAAQFAQASAAMSAEWDLLNKRLRSKCRRAGVDRVGYFRVIELHRNGWPHYHAVLEHPTFGLDDLAQQLSGWSPGRIDVRSISLDDAVGELAPYLVCSEKKSNGHKAYQFAAHALPAGFRLHSSSRGFLADANEPDGPTPTHGIALRGHFTGYHEAVREMGADARLVLYAPTDGDHVPPSRTLATGDAAVVYYAELVHQSAMHADPRWLRPLLDLLDHQGEDT